MFNKYSNISHFLEQFKTTRISDIVQISMQCIICYLMDFFFMRDDHFLLIFVFFFFGCPVWFLGSQFPNQELNLEKPNQGFPLQQKHGVLTTELSGHSLLLGILQPHVEFINMSTLHVLSVGIILSTLWANAKPKIKVRNIPMCSQS